MEKLRGFILKDLNNDRYSVLGGVSPSLIERVTSFNWG
jgi:hypothetical protein